MLKSETCDSVEGYVKCVEHKTVCHSCYLECVTNYPEDLIFSEWEVEEYFGEA
jgi:hypothetical protein